MVTATGSAPAEEYLKSSKKEERVLSTKKQEVHIVKNIYLGVQESQFERHRLGKNQEEPREEKDRVYKSKSYCC